MPDFHYKRKYAKIHRYWGRRPWYVIRPLIQKYSKENDLILDSFCGSGTTIIESLILKRRAIGFDLNPMSKFLTETTIEYVDISDLMDGYEELRKKVEGDINALYKLNPENIEISNWYPEDYLPISHYSVMKPTKVEELFSRRNLAATAILFEGINGSSADNKVINLLKLAFTASLAQFTKMIRDYKRPDGGSGSWYLNSYRIPKNFKENNVWQSYSNKIKAIIGMRKEINELIGKNYDYQIYTRSAKDLSFIDDESIDYVFIDPPWIIKYFDLSFLWCSWLGFELDFNNEIHHLSNTFMEDIYQSINEIHRVLKPNHFFSLNFASKNNNNLALFENELNKRGFEWINTYSLINLNPSYQQSFDNALKDSYLINLHKTSKSGSNFLEGPINQTSLDVFEDSELSKKEIGLLKFPIETIIRSTLFQNGDSILKTDPSKRDKNCEFCKFLNPVIQESDPTFIGKLSTSVALLGYDQKYKGRTIVIYMEHETDLNNAIKNNLTFLLSFLADVSRVVETINLSFNPDKINYAIMMNVQEHLHIHIIPRYKSDDNYGKPPNLSLSKYEPEKYDYKMLAKMIRDNLNTENDASLWSKYLCKLLANK